LDEEKTVSRESLGPLQWIAAILATIVLFIFFLWEIPVVSTYMSGF